VRASRRARALLAAGVALVTLLPFVRGLLRGQSLYFRDLALHFLPLRRFALQGLATGELRWWNPLLHEGIPSAFPPVSYPLELLQLLRPDAAGISMVLALHVPLAALAFLVLAWTRGVTPAAGAAGALVYALGGFALSTLNLYVYAHALAWAPLVVWALGRAGGGRARDVLLAGATIAVAFSTFGVELVLQAVAAGVVLAFAKRREVLERLGASVLLGLVLAAPALLPLRALVAASQRGLGFPTEVALAHSVHPLTWPQVLVAGWHGQLGDIANTWWGANFFPRGFPYVLSLYLGAAALSLAVAGARTSFPGRARLLLLAAAGVLVCLGRYAALEPVVETLAPLRAFRYPVKAFFTVHLSAALLVAHGVGALERAEGGAWRAVTRAALGAGAALVLLSAVPVLAPSVTSWFLAGFTPPDLTWAARDAVLRLILADAARGAVAALALGGVGVLVLLRRLAAPRAGAAAALLVAADLLRAGAGLNPQVEPAFFQPAAELAQALPALRAGRVYTCPTHESPAYWQARAARPGRHELWTFATQVETLTPETNLPLGVPTAYSEDFTSLLPPALVPRRGDSCRAFEALAPRLRDAGVTRVLSLDPLPAPPLALEATWRPARIAPLAVHVYALDQPAPRYAVLAPGGGEAGRVLAVTEGNGRVEIVAEADAPGLLVVRDGYFPGWHATVNGRAAPVERVEAVHRGIALAAGRSAVTLVYEPPGLRAGLVVAGLGMAAAAAAALPRRWRARLLPAARPA
jgi:hypothetical protein